MAREAGGKEGSEGMSGRFEDEAASIIKQAAPRTGIESSGAVSLETGRLRNMIANALQAAEARGYYKALRDARTKKAS